MAEVPGIPRDQGVAMRHGGGDDQHVHVAGGLAEVLKKASDEAEQPRRRVAELQKLESAQYRGRTSLRCRKGSSAESSVQG
jgi:hypothetical protein